MTPQDFKQWQLAHYAARIEEEQERGNTDAVRWLKNELKNLKAITNE
jgi:hypothetical protein